ncbi:hypothetical protein R6Q57_018272 [Mikania cordata]
MKQHDVKEEFVYDVFNQQVEEAWKAMNQESLKCKDLVPMPLMMRAIISHVLWMHFINMMILSHV